MKIPIVLERFRMYVKTFEGFFDGMKEIRSITPIGQSVSQALERVPVPDVMVRVADLLELSEAYVMFALLHQAYSTGKDFNLRHVFAKANSKGFTYRTKSGFIFGWRRMGKTQIYKFFVILGPTSKYKWIEVAEHNLLNLGWHRMVERKYVKSEGLIEQFELKLDRVHQDRIDQ